MASEPQTELAGVAQPEGMQDESPLVVDAADVLHPQLVDRLTQPHALAL